MRAVFAQRRQPTVLRPALGRLAAVAVVAAAAVVIALLVNGRDEERAEPPRTLLTPPSASLGAAHCRRVAAPRGHDQWPGTRRRPYRTVARLVRSLRSGQTGCLRAGTYAAYELTLRTPRTRLTSFPGERARLTGRLRITADGVAVDRLTLDGRNGRSLPSPTVNGDDVVLRANDVSNRGTSGCFLLGSTAEVRRPVIEGNRIHDCGDPGRLYGHGIYMQNVVGARVEGNLIYDNADRGIKVGPDSDFSLIRGNVIDGNPIGLNFSGADMRVSSDNIVERNVITNATRWYNVQSYWPDGQVGERNVVRFNCVFASNPKPSYRENGGISPGPGFTAHANVVADPRYVDRAAKDFRLKPRSPCLSVVGTALSAR